MPKKIGKEVLFLRTDEKCPRNGEGGFLRLKTGRILYAYTRYNGKLAEDDSPADIYGVYSDDEGETWSEAFLIRKCDAGLKNLMSVSLLRMANGDAGMFYLQKGTNGSCILVLIRSSDEGTTWSEPIRCMKEDNFFVTNNDRVIRLKSGRILVPANLHRLTPDGTPARTGQQCCFASDDDGFSWFELSQRLEIPFPGVGYGIGLQETGLFQFENGEVWAYSRTEFGMQYECFSKDEGKTWSTVRPNPFFTSPVSPMLVKKVGAYTAAVYNPIPWNSTLKKKIWSGRTPYVCAISNDDGRTFSEENVFYLEDDLNNEYCYPAILEVEDGFLVAYYHHSDRNASCLNSLKMVKVYFKELDALITTTHE